jgi:hypothetical protein
LCIVGIFVGSDLLRARAPVWTENCRAVMLRHVVCWRARLHRPLLTIVVALSSSSSPVLDLARLRVALSVLFCVCRVVNPATTCLLHYSVCCALLAFLPLVSQAKAEIEMRAKALKDKENQKIAVLLTAANRMKGKPILIDLFRCVLFLLFVSLLMLGRA